MRENTIQAIEMCNEIASRAKSDIEAHRQEMVDMLISLDDNFPDSPSWDDIQAALFSKFMDRLGEE